MLNIFNPVVSTQIKFPQGDCLCQRQLETEINFSNIVFIISIYDKIMYEYGWLYLDGILKSINYGRKISAENYPYWIILGEISRYIKPI